MCQGLEIFRNYLVIRHSSFVIRHLSFVVGDRVAPSIIKSSSIKSSIGGKSCLMV